MISITLQCSCGQNFVFDVEPYEGRMPSAVACPACGLDATDLANEQIQRQLTASAPSAPSEKSETLKILGACVAALALLALAGGAFVWWKSHNEKTAVPEMASSAPQPETAASAPAIPTPAPAQSEPVAPVEPSAPIATTTPETAVEPQTVALDPSLVAVGALFDRNLKTRHVEITTVIANSPAKKAGIVKGDILLSVDGTPIEDLPLKEIANMFFGPVGSKITMELISSKTGETNLVKIVRKKFRR